MKTVGQQTPGEARKSLALFAGAGFMLLHLWVRQDFEALSAFLTSLPARGLGAWFGSILTLAVSWGLSGASFWVGLLLAGVGVAPAPLAITGIAWQDLPRRARASARAGLTGILAGLRALGNLRPFAPRALVGWRRDLANWLGVRQRQLAFLGLGLLFGLTAALAAGDGERMQRPVLALLAWALGIILAVAGGWRGERAEDRLPGARATLVGFALLVGVGFALRAWNTEGIPITLTGDEGSVGLDALRFLRGQANNLFDVGWFSFPSLFYFLQSVSIALFGQTIPALRLPSALAGGLTVGAVFVMGRALFGRRVGLLAALYLAVFHFHMHFSRLGLNNIWDGLSYTVVLGALWVGHHTPDTQARPRRAAYLLSGIGLGLSQYFYVSSRALWLIIPAWLLLAGLRNRERLRRDGPDLALMAFVALVVTLPLGWFFVRHPDEWLAPMRRVALLGAEGTRAAGVSGGTTLAQKLALSLQAFTHAPLSYPFYHPGTPILQSVPATLFLLGVLWLLFHPRDSRTHLLGLWLVTFVLVGGLSDYTPAAQRYVAAAPACALVVALGLHLALERLERVWTGRRVALAVLAAVFLAMLAADELHFYFREYAPVSPVGGANTLVAQHLADFLQDKPAYWQVVFFGGERMGFQSIRSLPYLAPQIEGLDMTHPWGSPENPSLTGDHLYFVFLPGQEADLQGVRRSYPHGKLQQENDLEGNLLYWLYAVSGPEGEG